MYRDVSVQIALLLELNVYKWDLLWLIWSLRVCCWEHAQTLSPPMFCLHLAEKEFLGPWSNDFVRNLPVILQSLLLGCLEGRKGSFKGDIDM